jgi:hypothetical protein
MAPATTALRPTPAVGHTATGTLGAIATGGDATTKTPQPTVPAVQRSSETTSAPLSPGSSPSSPDVVQVEEPPPGWLRLALVLAVAGIGLIMLGGWELLRRQRKP